jgi:hypothetical protein
LRIGITLADLRGLLGDSDGAFGASASNRVAFSPSARG